MDRRTQQVYNQSDVGNQDQVTRALSLVVKLPKSVRNKIFLQNLRDAALSTRPQELSATCKIHYSAERLATDKRLFQSSEDITPVLQVVSHTLAHLVRPRDAEKVSFREQLHSLTLESRDLCFT